MALYEFKHVKDICDATALYDLIIKRDGLTVREFVENLLTNDGRSEYGEIAVAIKGRPSGGYYCGRREPTIKSIKDSKPSTLWYNEDALNRIVIGGKATGGWGHTDYLLKVKEETKMAENSSVRILKEGNIEIARRKRLQIKKFICDECGCEFEAGNDVYTETVDGGAIFFHCECPCCGADATIG